MLFNPREAIHLSDFDGDEFGERGSPKMGIADRPGDGLHAGSRRVTASRLARTTQAAMPCWFEKGMTVGMLDWVAERRRIGRPEEGSHRRQASRAADSRSTSTLGRATAAGDRRAGVPVSVRREFRLVSTNRDAGSFRLGYQ